MARKKGCMRKIPKEYTPISFNNFKTILSISSKANDVLYNSMIETEFTIYHDIIRDIFPKKRKFCEISTCSM
jgi:hypothetical protein